MKFYYITAMKYDQKVVMCVGSEVEYYGYDGARISIEVQFRNKEDANSEVGGRVATFTAEEVEKVMSFYNDQSTYPSSKEQVMNNGIVKWKDAFCSATDIKIVEVVVDI